MVRWQYRATDSRISSAVLVKANGFGSVVVAAMSLLMACSWARELKEPAFAAREVLAGKDVRSLARNAAVVLGNVGAADDSPVLEAALEHDEPLVREHAAAARRRPQVA